MIGLLSVLLIAAVALDLVIGEPPSKLHPVVWIGSLISALDGQGRGRSYGVLVFVVTLVFAWALWLIPYFLLIKYSLLVPLLLVLWVYLLKSSFSWKLMRSYGKRIALALEIGDLEAARKLTSEIVRRDLADADEGLIASAAIESIAEGEVDGLTSPLLYYPFGILGPLAQRAINTLDSMVGYPYPPFRDVGWASAKADTILNYVPARLTSLLIAIAALLIGLNWKESVAAALRDHRKTKSVNGGWPMSAMAGALGVRLVKRGEYELGSGNLPSASEIRLAIRVYDVSASMFVVMVAALSFFPLFAAAFPRFA
ncbi:cobalamin biosynthesis protein [Tardisphaera saccharovorans]